MAFNLIPFDRNQALLMPHSLDDWLPEDHLARFVCDVVERFDLSGFHADRRTDGWGRAAYDPKMMLTLLLYCYSIGCRSSRQMERRCVEDIAVRYICANNRPDHATISRFRAGFQDQIAGLFVSTLELCSEAGLVSLGVVALDGTKMAASASKDATRRRKEIEAEVKRIMDEANTIDEQEDAKYGDARGDELPEVLRDRSSREAWLKERMERLDRKHDKELDKQREAIADKTARHKRRAEKAKAIENRGTKRKRSLPQAEADLDVAMTEAETVITRRQQLEQRHVEQGAKTRGSKPDLGRVVRQAEQEYLDAKQRDEQVRQEMQINTTDPDSGFMKTRQGFIQGYNAQAIVNEEQIILAAEVSDNQADAVSFLPMLDVLARNLDAIGTDQQVGVLLADAGYLSEENLTAPGPDRLIATAKSHKLRRKAKQEGYRTDPPPEDATPTQRMEHRLITEQGSQMYAKRGQTIEPVFGQIKEGRSCRRFMRRGMAAVDSEWKFIATAHNLLKLFLHKAKGPSAIPAT